jgi:hypothetical protein
MRFLTPLTTLGATVLLAGCGSSSNSSTITAASSKYTQALAFSQCMRAHGVSKFPDPSQNGGLLIQGGPGQGLDPGSPAFKAAQEACKSKLPNGGNPQAVSAAQRQKALQFSQCMRAHGISNFPDPTFSGPRVQLKISAETGINPSSPAFEAAQKACGGIIGKAP